MQDKGAVVSILALRVIELPVCGLYCLVCYCWLAKSIRRPTFPTMGSAGFIGLHGNTHRHDCGESATSV
jgi:hypothetical protein